MKLSEQIMDAVGQLDESLLEQSEKKKRNIIAWKYPLAAVFGVLVLMLGMPLLLNTSKQAANDASVPAGGAEMETIPETMQASGEEIKEEYAITSKDIDSKSAQEDFWLEDITEFEVSCTVEVRISSENGELAGEELNAEMQRIKALGFAVTYDDALYITAEAEQWKDFIKDERYTYAFRQVSAGEGAK
ncbi:MAG: hypothetical protein K6A40_05460 [Solobacterium sp.]|nr:hypothetical protein [Solobacterium sp.]